MGERTALLALAVLTGLLVAGAAATPAAAAGSPAASPDNSSGDYSLEELRQGGTQPAGKAPSTRWLSDAATVWVDHPHHNPVKRTDAEDWQAQQLLEPGKTVQVNTLRFHYSGPRGDEGARYKLKIVYWDVDRQTTPNGSTTRLANVTTQTVTLQFSGASDVVEVDLRAHYGGAVRVTMWLEKPNGATVDGARWRFQHATLKTQQPVTTDTAGERLWWAFTNYVVWVVGLGALAFTLVFWAKRKALAPPKLGLVTWAFAIGIATVIALLGLYDSVASLLVDSPHWLAALTVAALAVPVLEYQQLDRWLFVQPKLKTGLKGASGDEVMDALTFDLDSQRVVRDGSGRLAVVSTGLRPFFARLLGGVAYLEGADDMPTQGRATGDSRYNAIVWADADAADALEYEKEGFEFDVPTGGRRLIAMGVAAIFLAAVGPPLGLSTWVGAMAFPLFSVRVKDARAECDTANAHQRAAYVTALYGYKEHAEAETLEEVREDLLEARAHNQRDVQRALDRADLTTLSAMFSEDMPDVEALEGQTDGDGLDPVRDVDPDATDTNGDASAVDRMADRLLGGADSDE